MVAFGNWATRLLKAGDRLPRLSGSGIAIVAGAGITLGLGALVVNAQENVMRVVMEAQRPIRQGFEAILPRETLRLPPLMRREQPNRHSVTLHGRSVAQTLASRPSQPELLLIQPPRLPELPSLAAPKPDSKALANRARRAKERKTAWQAGKGLTQATNYCVRTCDGYAFPIGPTGGSSTQAAHEVACTLACPGAQTALYSAPAGAMDIDSAIRAGRPYSALPTAFRYRQKLDSACACRPVGATQSSAALLGDFTLRRGDLAMTRIGIRHFDGGTQRLPHKAAAFSDGVAKLKSRRERDQVRAMEAASVRGLIPANAQAFLRERVSEQIRIAERLVSPPRLEPVRRAPGSFEVLRPAQLAGPQPVRVIQRRAGIVAMN